MNKIELIQKPIIKHELEKVGKSVTERINALNIKGQVATEATVKSLKELRAELNKELSEFELQRKAIKEAVMNPYSELEATYKIEISEKYKGAIDTLKDKIAEVENRIKADKLEEVKSYFVELVLSEDIDFISYNQVGVDINLSTSMKKYREQVDAFVGKVKDDLALIATQEHQAEILVEYKKSLNVSQAITSVTKRKDAEKAEKARLKMLELQARTTTLTRLAMIYHDITRTYNYAQDESIMISLEQIENLPKDQFDARVLEIVASINATKKIDSPAPRTQAPASQKPIEQPTQTPITSYTEEIMTAQFECQGTYSQLQRLGEYMKSNNITYKNI